jgi:adenylate dimethylallyltransferase
MKPTRWPARDGRCAKGVDCRQIHLIVGPTSTEKTARSIELAKALEAPVVAMDRIQIYDDLAVTSGRPSELELEGTRRLYLDHRLASADCAEMPATTALEKLREMLAQIEGDVILEGGSISLWQAFFAVAGNAAVFGDVVVRKISEWPKFTSHVSSRILRLLRASPWSMLDELSGALANAKPGGLVLGLVGVPEVLAWCVERGVSAKMLPELKSDLGACRSLAERIAPAWAAYTCMQQASFEILLRERNHVVENVSCGNSTRLARTVL